jgi:hypothetical protein
MAVKSDARLVDLGRPLPALCHAIKQFGAGKPPLERARLCRCLQPRPCEPVCDQAR